MELKDVEHLAHLARINLPEDEKASFLNDMKSILGYIDQISSVDTSGVDLTLPDHRNIIRDDIATNETGFHTEVLLSEAPESENGFVKVKQIL